MSQQTVTTGSNAVTFLRALLPQHTLTAGSKYSKFTRRITVTRNSYHRQ